MNEPRIIEFKGSLFSKSKSMDLQTFSPSAVWNQFMPRLSGITNRLNNDLISLRAFEYIPHLTHCKPKVYILGNAETEVKIDGFDHIYIPSGTYAVFHYKGLSSDSTIGNTSMESGCQIASGSLMTDHILKDLGMLTTMETQIRRRHLYTTTTKDPD